MYFNAFVMMDTKEMGLLAEVCNIKHVKISSDNTVDINECETDSHDCDAYATCTNLIGSFNCTCEDGFSGDGMICANDTLAVQLRGFYSGSFLTNAIKHATNSAPTLAEHTFMYISILYFFVNFF